MTDPESIQAFVHSKPKAARSFWQKLRNAFKQLRKKIDGTFAAEKKILRRMSTAEQLWADAFHEASQRANGTQSNESKTKARKPETTKSLAKKAGRTRGIRQRKKPPRMAARMIIQNLLHSKLMIGLQARFRKTIHC